MLRVVVATLALAALASAACKDKVDNVFTIEDINDPALDIHLQGVKVGTYEKNGSPSCGTKEANIKMPGLLKLLEGKIRVSTANDLAKITGKMTLKKNSFVVGTVCENGVVKNPLVPKDACEIDASSFLPDGLKKMLSTPGEYDLSQIEQQLGSDGTITLPAPPAAIVGILKGEWQGGVGIVNGKGRVVTNVKFPANTKWVHIE